MSKAMLSGLMAILFLSTFGNAQFKLKIPKRIKSKTSNMNVNKGKRIGSSSGKNRQMVIDDGFTFFEATPVKAHSPKFSGYIAKGWTLTGHLRAFGTFPDNSTFKMIVMKNGKTLATYSCEAKIQRKTDIDVYQAKQSRFDDDFMRTFSGSRCGYNENIFVKSPGKYDVQIYLINGDNDEETFVRTYKIDVREAKKTRSRGIPGVSDFYIQRHAEAPVAMLYLRSGIGGIYAKHDYHWAKQGVSLQGNVEVYFNVATNSNGVEFAGTPHVRCFVNGKRLKFINKGFVTNGTMRRDGAKYERDGKKSEYMAFHNYWINLPIDWRSNGTSRNPNMENLSGEWKCDLRVKAETLRTFSWTVGQNGFPVEHPEQTSGNVNLHWGAYLIDVKIPEGGSSIDYSLKPMTNSGLFYGIPWKSTQGKKMANTVPTKGKPFLMP